jgi:hypothetical protein
MKICMDFGPYDAFPSSDVPKMVDQQNSWNSLVKGTYHLCLAWNVGMLAGSGWVSGPQTPPPPHTLIVLLIPKQKKRIKSWGHKKLLQCRNRSRIKNTTYNTYLGSMAMSMSWKIGTTMWFYLEISTYNHMVYLAFPFSQALSLYHSSCQSLFSSRLIFCCGSVSRIVRKRADANCSSFHLRVFLGLSNRQGQRQTSTISIPPDNIGERKAQFNLETSRTTQVQLYKCINIP